MKELILFLFVILIIYFSNKLFKLFSSRKNETNELISEAETKEEIEIRYELNTDKVKYWFYDCCHLDYLLSNIYDEVVRKNLWNKEPFHSVFFNILMTFNNNEFMIIDPNSRVITLNMRDSNNKMLKSKSYQVYDSIAILYRVLKETRVYICKHEVKKAQSIVLAICIIVLKNSTNKLFPNDISTSFIDGLVSASDNIDYINTVVEMIKSGDSKYIFVKNALDIAFISEERLPFNDIELSKKPMLPVKLPKKVLQYI